MFNILPVRKLIKVVSSKRGVAKRDRVPTSLTDDLDKNVPVRNNWQIFVLIFTLLLLIWFINLFVSSYYMTYAYIPVFKSSEEANKSAPLNGSDEKLPICFVDVYSFGNISINENVTEIPETEYSAVQRGGYYAPDKCWSRHKVALLVPYRNRKKHLASFLFNIHPFLMNQKLEYRIFIIEQKGTAPFNRGRLFNAGFKEVKKFGSWKCMVLHDVDLLPINGRVMYSCPIWPRHMCATITGFENPSFYKSFGGVSIIRPEHYEKINGFSNRYWGWGGEDTDLFRRIRTHGLPVVSYSRKIAIYRSLNHSKQIENSLRFALLKTATERCYYEGLSNLRYAVESVTLHHLYTHIIVDINPYNERIEYLTE